MLGMDELGHEEDDIALWLDSKKIALENCHILMNFSQSGTNYGSGVTSRFGAS